MLKQPQVEVNKPDIMSCNNNNISEVDNITNLISAHLKCNNLSDFNDVWKIGQSPLGDRGMFAKRDIKAGQVIFVDYPLLIGPRVSSENICISCYKTKELRFCSRKCGLLICSKTCENTAKHLLDCKKLLDWNIKDNLENYKKLVKCMAPVHALSLRSTELELLKLLKAHPQYKHGIEVDILKTDLLLEINNEDEVLLRHICAVLDANAFEMIIDNDETETISVRAIYCLAAFANHSCVPNTVHVFDNKQYMIVRALVDIKQDEEIFYCYNKIFWGTPTRRFHLSQTKHFACGCERCRDPTEFGTYISALLCRKCPEDGPVTYVVPIDPLNANSKWRCGQCGDVQDGRQVGFVTSVLGGRLESLYEVEDILNFLKVKLKQMVPINCNQIAIELKYQLMWILGNRKGYFMEDLSEDLLDLKETICRDLLKLLDKLRTGECKLKGLILYALYRCCVERRRRHLNSENMSEQNNDEDSERNIQNLLKISSQILLYDVGAPAEIKKQWIHQSIIDTLQ